MEPTIDQDQLHFAHPFSMILAGGRRTGKTYFTKTLLERNRDLISVPLDTIVWFYGASQEQVFSELAETIQGYGQRIEFFCG